nr:unnamed protein product [Callosobruchus chinensis]
MCFPNFHTKRRIRMRLYIGKWRVSVNEDV